VVSVVIRPYGTCGEGRLRVPALKCRAIFFASLRDALGTVGLSLIPGRDNGQTPGRSNRPAPCCPSEAGLEIIGRFVFQSNRLENDARERVVAENR